MAIWVLCLILIFYKKVFFAITITRITLTQ
jgi:hypothetical protein